MVQALIEAKDRAKRALLLEVRTHGAVCLSRFSMQRDFTIEDLRQAGEELVEEGRIRRVPGLGETFERA
jgi:hypothetical protein